MLEIINPSSDPYFNMALEDYLIHNLNTDENLFMLWQNRPAIIVGRHQNSAAEINSALVREKGIEVVRRLSGGGAVYHDEGNLNFTFICKDPGINLDFAAFTNPVIKVLNRLGIPANHTGRNDIEIKGRKFSGNAQYRFKDRLMHHGTILFDSNLEEMSRVLQVSKDKNVARGIASVRSRVTNITEHLSHPLSLPGFKQLLTDTIFEHSGPQKRLVLGSTEMQAVDRLRGHKYMSWDWNYGQSPQYSQRRGLRFAWGGIEALLLVKNGRIAQCHFYGDFFTIGALSRLEKGLVGQPLREAALRATLQELDPQSIISGATVDQLISLLVE